MSIALVQVVNHLSFGERPEYGQPYPDGLAVSSQTTVGDATGGDISFNVNAPAGFLYRYEMVRGNLDTDVAEDWDLILTHAWATDKVDMGAGAFNINHIMFRSVGSGAEIQLEPDINDTYHSMHRFPIGSLTTDVDQLIVQVNIPTNTLGRNYKLVCLFTYWRKQSTYLPGFLSSFFEAPAVPPLLR